MRVDFALKSLKSESQIMFVTVVDRLAEAPRKEEFRVSGGELVEKVKEIVHEGNIRRIIVKHDDKTVVEIPLTVGVIGALIAPQIAALGVIGALLTKCTIIVEKEEEE